MGKKPVTTVRGQYCIDTTRPDDVIKTVEVYMNYLVSVDRDNMMTNAHSCEAYDINSKHDKPKLRMLANILSDILGETEPTDDELDGDDDAIALYDELHNLKEALQNCGYDV